MAIRLTELANKKAEIEFSFDGETVKAEIYPHKVTPTYRAQLQRLDEIEDDETRDSAIVMIHDLMASWDVEGEPGVPFEPTIDNLKLVPNTLLGATCRAIWEKLGELMSGATGS